MMPAAALAVGTFAIVSLVAISTSDVHHSISPTSPALSPIALPASTSIAQPFEDPPSSVPATQLSDSEPTTPTSTASIASVPVTSASSAIDTNDTEVDVTTPWPIDPTPTGATVPNVRPTVDLDGLTLTRRYDNTEEIINNTTLSTPYLQTFINADASAFLVISSSAQPSGISVSTPFTTIGSWQISDRPMAPGIVGIDLVAEQGVVMLSGAGTLTREDLIDVAAGLRRRADGAAGWDVTALPSGLLSFSDTWQTWGPYKDLGWYDNAGILDGELQYGRLNPTTLLTAIGAVQVISIGQRQVFTLESFQLVSMFWREDDGTYYRLALSGRTEAEAIAVVDSLTTVTPSDWLALPQPAPTTDDGCDSLFC